MLYGMTLEVNCLLTTRNTRMDIFWRTRASVLDSVKSDLNNDDPIEEIETIWEDFSVENNNLHMLDAKHGAALC